MSEINKTGTTVVMVTHEHDLVYRFNHRIITIDKGSVVSDSKSANKSVYSQRAQMGGYNER